MKIQKYRAEIRLENRPVQVLAYVERRKDVRFAITSKGVSIRLPQGIKSEDIQKSLSNLENWVASAIEKKPTLRPRIFGNDDFWKTGDQLSVGQKNYTFNIVHEERDSHAAKLENGTIQLRLSTKGTEKARQKAARHLISRMVAADFQAEITRRVLDLNKKHFQQPIRSVNLKYNQSNWGSCSAKSNLNFSTRLLLAPEDVQDYVIVHELAHLIELNHSDRFWALVERAMPDFREKERWLKTHGRGLDF